MKELPDHEDELGIEGGAQAPYGLSVYLVELPQPPRLGPLIPEHGPDGVELGDGGLLVEVVLDVGPDDRCRGLGPQGYALTSLILEGIHLLLHDVRGLPDAAGEELRPLEYGDLYLAVAVAVKRAAGGLLGPLPVLDLPGQHVLDPPDSRHFLARGHHPLPGKAAARSSGRTSPAFPMMDSST